MNPIRRITNWRKKENERFKRLDKQKQEFVTWLANIAYIFMLFGIVTIFISLVYEEIPGPIFLLGTISILLELYITFMTKKIMKENDGQNN